VANSERKVRSEECGSISQDSTCGVASPVGNSRHLLSESRGV